MFKFLRILAVFLMFGASVFAQQREWKNFSPPNKAWTIYAPGEMKPDQEAQTADSKKGSYAYNDFAGFYAVVWRDSPKRIVPWKPNYKAHFKKVRKEIVNAAKGEVIKEQDFSGSEFSGREVYVKVPFGTITGIEGQTVKKFRIQRFRMFFHGDRFYLLLTVLPESEADSAETNRFFASFTAK